MKRALIALVPFAATFAASSAFAAPPWVDRNITLPRHDWAFDLGLGIAHDDRPAPDRSLTGPGMNLEMGVGVTDRIELGLRTGIRMGTDARRTAADAYGRLFDRQTYNLGGDAMSNPEFRIRGALAKHDIAEVALEGRVIFPAATGSYLGVVPGLPLMFHIGHSVRLDTGVFMPIVFNRDNQDRDATFWALSAPLDVWIQTSPKLWLGPMTGILYHHDGPGRDTTDVQLGFGLGYQITRIVDFKTMLYIPRINGNDSFRAFGVGAGVQIRIE